MSRDTTLSPGSALTMPQAEEREVVLVQLCRRAAGTSRAPLAQVARDLVRAAAPLQTHNDARRHATN